MNCQDIDAHLADYLGEELDAAQRAPFEAHLAECPTCRAEVRALGGTIESLRALPGVSTEDALRRTADLTVIRRPAPLRRIMLATLKAAAMMGFGMFLGWAAFGRGPDTSSSPSGGRADRLVVKPIAIEDGVHPAWYQRGRQVASVPSSFARHLAMIAPRHRSRMAPASNR